MPKTPNRTATLSLEVNVMHQTTIVQPDPDARVRLLKSAGVVWRVGNLALRARHPGAVRSAFAYAAIGLFVGLIVWVCTRPRPGERILA